MPFLYDVDELSEIAYVTVRGVIGLECAIKATVGLAAQPGFDPRYRVLADLRGCDYVPSVRDVLRIASNLGFFRTFYLNRVAVVLSDPPLFRRAQLATFLARLRGLSMRPFEDVDEAIVWLDGSG